MTNVEQLITRHEGDRQFPYCDKCGVEIRRVGMNWECRCTASLKVPGNMTIAVGRNLTANGLDQLEREMLLANDLNLARAAAMAYQWFSQLDQVRAAAIVDLMFNLGAVKFAGFPKFIAAMAAGDYASADAELRNSLADHEEPRRIGELGLMLVGGAWPQGEF